jgi:hypothetical protein
MGKNSFPLLVPFLVFLGEKVRKIEMEAAIDLFMYIHIGREINK